MRLSFIITFVVAVLAGMPAWSAPAYVLVDVGAGAVLAENDGDGLWYPASVTKLMTAYLTFKALKSGQLKSTSPVVMSANALSEPPSKMGYQVGTVMNVDNALKMMIVKSANDIAVAVAETVGGSEAKFVALMNQEAQRLGMNSSHFGNPNGLPDDNNYTTARDLAVLARAIWIDYPDYRELFRIPAIKAGKKILRSQNSLLERYYGTNGMKTGFICASGFNMVASATRNGRTLIAVVLGATSSAERAETAAKLLDRGFSGAVGIRRSLASFGSARAVGSPANLQDSVCGKRRNAMAAIEADGDADLVISALGPRFALMDPIPVYTGRADPVPGTAAPAPAPAPAVKAATNIPLPRLRPPYSAGADAGSAFKSTR